VVKAKIEIEEIEGSIKVTGTAENLSEIVQSLSIGNQKKQYQ
jgi:hypothetical protein